jgi:hypothetical protein
MMAWWNENQRIIPKGVKKYIFSCFLLLIPILLWNILLAEHLPDAFQAEIFWKDIPPFISYGENICRITVMIFPLFMILSLKSKRQRAGFFLYLIGTLLYGLSWLAIIIYPDSDWSQHVVGFTAPAFTPLIWLIGIGLIGEQAFFKIKHLPLIYGCLSILFTVFHTLHAYLIYERL